ncbi:MAG: glycosyltransferase family 2 protein, partial [Thermoanaerobaculia bacterium]|nr:glycosyltransferase family 2 protein [Thermoanaerobaculia bacterium]
LRDVAIHGVVFDTEFFTYREDADLAWRARLFGWTSYCVPSAEGTHVRTVTPEKRGELSSVVNYHGVKNRFLLRLKNPGPHLFLRTLPRTLVRDLVVLGATMTVERTSFPAWGWLFRNLGRTLEKRREIQRRRTIPDAEILRWFE